MQYGCNMLKAKGHNSNDGYIDRCSSALAGPAAISAQVQTRLTPSKQARTTEMIGVAMTTHNFSSNPLAYDYESDYAHYSDDYYSEYDYEHMQAMWLRMGIEGGEPEGMSRVQEQAVAS